MQLADFWKIFLITTQYSSALISLLLNSILILLILFRSPPNLGNYKYLMLYIVIFQIVYSIWDVITEPTILSYGPAFFIFRKFKTSVFGREESFFLLIVFCGLFGVSLAMFAIHFVYRYGAISKEFRDKYLSGRKIYILFSIPILYGTIWTTICGIFFHFTPNTDKFARGLLLDTYDTRIEDLSYVIVWFYPEDQHKETHPDWRIFFAISFMWGLIISSLFCVIFFGFNCYTQLSRALVTTRMASKTTKSLQQQLFLALVVQTVIPVILMYIPVAILYSFPMAHVDAGYLGSFIAATVAVYPAIDPLPTMFIVKNFRETILCRRRPKAKEELNPEPPNINAELSVARPTSFI